MSDPLNPSPDETGGGGAESIPKPESPDAAPQAPEGPNDPLTLPDYAEPQDGAVEEE